MARAPALVLHTFGMHVDLSFSYLRFAEAVSFDIKKSYVGAVHSPVEGGWISNSRPLFVLLSHVHVHRDGAVPGGLFASDDGGWVDPSVVPPSQELVGPSHQPVQVVDLHPGADASSISLPASP